MSERITIPKSSYSPAIDGLRAIAVLAVIINHFNENLLPGGYLGVDVFFVISGFVITQSLLGRKKSGLFCFLLEFYKRRIKRIFPALLFCFVGAVMLISFFNPDPYYYITTGIYSLVGLSNIDLYLRSIDYWGEAAKLNPFTHTWSLGVEEQFYFLFPFLFWVFIARQGGKRQTGTFIGLLGAGIAVSLYSYIHFADKYNSATYFLLPYRFWELGMGCVLALFLSYGKPPSFLSVKTGVILLPLLSVFFVPPDYGVVGRISSVVLASIVILSIRFHDYNGRSGTGFLDYYVVVYIGTISYSLYLWHWVVLVVSRSTIGDGLEALPISCALILFFSLFSYHFVENPLRRIDWCTLRSGGVILCLVFMAALLSVIVFVDPKNTILYLGSKDNKVEDFSHFPLHINNQLSCRISGSMRGKKMLVVGNSHANHIVPMLAAIARFCSMELIYHKDPGYVVIPSGKHQDSDKIEREVSRVSPGGVLVLSSRNKYLYKIPYLNGRGDQWIDHGEEKKKNGYGLKVWLNSLDNILDAAEQSGVKVILFLPNVEFDQQVLNYKRMCGKEWFRINPRGCDVSVAKHFLQERFSDTFYQEVYKRAKERNHFFVFNPLPVYCPGKESCSRIVKGVVAFKDTNHLTPLGSLLMLDVFSLFLAENGIM